MDIYPIDMNFAREFANPSVSFVGTWNADSGCFLDDLIAKGEWRHGFEKTDSSDGAMNACLRTAHLKRGQVIVAKAKVGQNEVQIKAVGIVLARSRDSRSVPVFWSVPGVTKLIIPGSGLSDLFITISKAMPLSAIDKTGPHSELVKKIETAQARFLCSLSTHAVNMRF